MALKDHAREIAESRGEPASGVEFRHLNQRVPCSVPGCSKHRRGWSYFCADHANAKKAFGHPLGRKVPLSTLHPFIDQVKPVLLQNPNHGGLALARKWFRAMSDLAKTGKKFEMWQAFLLLEEARPLVDTIARVGGLFLFRDESHEADRYLHNTDQAFFANVGLVISTGMQFKANGLPPVKAKDAHVIGERLCKETGAFYLKLIRSLSKAAEARQSRLEILTEEWDEGVIHCPFCGRDVSKPCPPEETLDRMQGKMGNRTDPFTGEKYMTVKQLAERYGRRPGLVYCRLKLGWSLKEALATEPLKIGHKRMN